MQKPAPAKRKQQSKTYFDSQFFFHLNLYFLKLFPEAAAPNYSALESLVTNPNYIKYKVLFNFDGTRDDELSIKEGEIVNVDPTMRADEGWLWGELRGRTGVFPAGFTTKLSDLE